jgi:hypothetical protein
MAQVIAIGIALVGVIIMAARSRTGSGREGIYGATAPA